MKYRKSSPVPTPTSVSMIMKRIGTTRSLLFRLIRLLTSGAGIARWNVIVLPPMFVPDDLPAGEQPRAVRTSSPDVLSSSSSDAFAS